MKKRLLFSGLCFLVGLLAGCSDTENSADITPSPTAEPAKPLEIAEKELYFPIPEGFTPSEDGSVYYCPDYPDKSATIVVSVDEKDEMGACYTKESFEKMLTETFADAGIIISDFEIFGFEEGKIEDYDSLLIDFAYTLDGIKINQMEYIVEIEGVTYNIALTQTNDDDYTDLFLKSKKEADIIIREEEKNE